MLPRFYSWATDSKQFPFPYLTRFPHKRQWILQDTSEHVTLARLSFRSTNAVRTALPAVNCPRPYPLLIKRCRTGLGSAASQGAWFRLCAVRFLACCFAIQRNDSRTTCIYACCCPFILSSCRYRFARCLASPPPTLMRRRAPSRGIS